MWTVINLCTLMIATSKCYNLSLPNNSGWQFRRASECGQILHHFCIINGRCGRLLSPETVSGCEVAPESKCFTTFKHKMNLSLATIKTDFLNKYLMSFFKKYEDWWIFFDYTSLSYVARWNNPDNLVSILKNKCGCCPNYSSKLTISLSCNFCWRKNV